MQILHKVLLPMTSVVDSVARRSLRIFGIKLPASAVITSTIEELRGAIDLHVGEGAIAHERAMLRSILDLTKVEVGKKWYTVTQCLLWIVPKSPHTLWKKFYLLPIRAFVEG